MGLTDEQLQAALQKKYVVDEFASALVGRGAIEGDEAQVVNNLIQTIGSELGMSQDAIDNFDVQGITFNSREEVEAFLEFNGVTKEATTALRGLEEQVVINNAKLRDYGRSFDSFVNSPGGLNVVGREFRQEAIGLAKNDIIQNSRSSENPIDLYNATQELKKSALRAGDGDYLKASNFISLYEQSQLGDQKQEALAQAAKSSIMSEQDMITETDGLAGRVQSTAEKLKNAITVLETTNIDSAGTDYESAKSEGKSLITQQYAIAKQLNVTYGRMDQDFKYADTIRKRDFGIQMKDSEEDRAKGLFRTNRDFQKSMLRSEEDFYRQRERSNYDFNKNVTRSTDDFNLSKERSVEDYNLSIERSEKDYQKSMSRSKKDYEKSMQRSQDDYNKSMTRGNLDYMTNMIRTYADYYTSLKRQAEDAAKSIYNPFQRVMSQGTADASTLIANLKDQNERIAKQKTNLEELQGRGLSMDAINTLNLGDASQAQQLERLLGSTDEEIQAINAAINSRQGATKDLTQSEFNQSFVRTEEDFKKSMSRSQEDFDKSIARSNEDFKLSIERSNFDFTQSISRSNADFRESLARGNDDFNKSMARSNDDFKKSMFRSYEDYSLAMSLSLEDYNRQRGYALIDFQQSLTDQQEDWEIHLYRIWRSWNISTMDIEENKRRQLKRMQEDFFGVINELSGTANQQFDQMAQYISNSFSGHFGTAANSVIADIKRVNEYIQQNVRPKTYNPAYDVNGPLTPAEVSFGYAKALLIWRT